MSQYTIDDAKKKSAKSSISTIKPKVFKMPAVRKNYRSNAVYFNNTIRNLGECGPGDDKSGFKQFLINKDTENAYRVTVVSTWINYLTGQTESYTKIYLSQPDGELYLGCTFEHFANNGDTKITRKITGEVKVPKAN